MKNISLIPAILIITACSQKAPAPAATEKTTSTEKIITLSEAQLQQAGLSFFKPEYKSLSGSIRVSGVIDVPPQNLVSVSAAMGGYVVMTKLLPGMAVKKGSLLATLQDERYVQLQEEYLVTQARLESAEAEYRRQEELQKNRAGTDKNLQQAKADYTALSVSSSALKEKLRLININPESLNDKNLSRNIPLYAPFDGFVTKVNVNVGKHVAPSETLFELVDPGDIHLNLKVFEKDLNQIRIGQSLEAFTTANPEKKHACSIILIGKTINTERNAEVHCHFNNYDQALLPGMMMNADIRVTGQQSLSVPEEALVSFEGKSYVFATRGKGRFEMLEVHPGLKEQGWIALNNAETLKDAELVGKGAYTLLMSLKNKSEG
ncbi:MAG: efflux RND transporter periplasmic adaptor subunit [Bacteroidetes bacterium]|nr:efflux RND transporter periplasmic adaptor subunit [Bacteroidota bacterium]